MDVGRNNDSFNTFTENLNELCLKTPEQKKILKTGTTQPKTANKVTFEPAPGTFNITFDTSDSESDEDLDLNAIVNQTTSPKSPEKPLAGVTVFVDVRAENENRSKAISRELERLGATVSEKISSNITHVVFKDGRKGTLSQLKKFPHIHTVSVLWVDACKTIGCKVNEALYPARHPDVENDGVLPAKVKRVKSLQPKTFEEDVNNSAKKEDRKRKRLKKLNKDYGTPTDQVICLDSQEYIKSSDLHKLVATPLAIPDTPWIINYINGTENESSKVSPDALCTKLGFDDANSENPMDQDVQCKLNFEDALLKPEKQNSCMISIGSSPTKKFTPLKNKNLPRTPKTRTPTATISRKEHLTKTCKDSTPARSTPSTFKQTGNYENKENTKNSTNLSNSVPKITKSITSTSKERKKSRTKSASRDHKKTEITSNKNAETVNGSSNDNLQHKKDESDRESEQSQAENDNCVDQGEAMEIEASSPLKRVSPNKEMAEETLVEGQRKKKKKKLMSKTQFSLPQEKLISPALKGSSNKETKEPVKTKKKQQASSSNLNSRPNTFTVLQNLENSKKTTSQETVTVISSSKQSRNIDNADISKAYTSFIEDNVLPNKVKEKIISSSPAASIIHEEPKVERRRSKRLTELRRSSIDFKVTKKFRKLKAEAEKSVQPALTEDRVPEEFSLTNDEPMDLNLSFVHDENEGLICTSQNSGTIIRIDDLPSDAIQTPDNDVECEIPLGEKNDEEAPREMETTTGEIDSGISDSEEINDDEVFPPHNEEPKITQPPHVKKSTKRSNISSKSKSITSVVSPKKKTSTSNRSINTTSNRSFNTTSNRSINTTSNQSINRTLNRTSSSKKFKNSIVCTSLHFSEQDFAKGAIKNLKEYQLKKNVAPDTSHVIAGSGRRTLNILHGITQGCWILSPKWISDSYEAGCWLAEEDYEMHKDFPAAKLTNAVRKAGLAIGFINCRRHESLKIISEKWILDTITNGRLMALDKYLITIPYQRATSPDY
ncbi:microcephalin-like isoform X2 [Clytia hemisphaerica]|uniref:microcephalin-like isoform X2 n=1 Tax=Clytia hemisphaerica TaxID=252671 RepID=UPI0034D3FE41